MDKKASSSPARNSPALSSRSTGSQPQLLPTTHRPVHNVPTAPVQASTGFLNAPTAPAGFLGGPHHQPAFGYPQLPSFSPNPYPPHPFAYRGQYAQPVPSHPGYDNRTFYFPPGVPVLHPVTDPCSTYHAPQYQGTPPPGFNRFAPNYMPQQGPMDYQYQTQAPIGTIPQHGTAATAESTASQISEVETPQKSKSTTSATTSPSTTRSSRPLVPTVAPFQPASAKKLPLMGNEDASKPQQASSQVTPTPRQSNIESSSVSRSYAKEPASTKPSGAARFTGPNAPKVPSPLKETHIPEASTMLGGSSKVPMASATHQGSTLEASMLETHHYGGPQSTPSAKRSIPMAGPTQPVGDPNEQQSLSNEQLKDPSQPLKGKDDFFVRTSHTASGWIPFSVISKPYDEINARILGINCPHPVSPQYSRGLPAGTGNMNPMSPQGESFQPGNTQQIEIARQPDMPQQHDIPQQSGMAQQATTNTARFGGETRLRQIIRMQEDSWFESNDNMWPAAALPATERAGNELSSVYSLDTVPNTAPQNSGPSHPASPSNQAPISGDPPFSSWYWDTQQDFLRLGRVHIQDGGQEQPTVDRPFVIDQQPGSARRLMGGGGFRDLREIWANTPEDKPDVGRPAPTGNQQAVGGQRFIGGTRPSDTWRVLEDPPSARTEQFTEEWRIVGRERAVRNQQAAENQRSTASQYPPTTYQQVSRRQQVTGEEKLAGGLSPSGGCPPRQQTAPFDRHGIPRWDNPKVRDNFQIRQGFLNHPCHVPYMASAGTGARAPGQPVSSPGLETSSPATPVQGEKRPPYRRSPPPPRGCTDQPEGDRYARYEPDPSAVHTFIYRPFEPSLTPPYDIEALYRRS